MGRIIGALLLTLTLSCSPSSHPVQERGEQVIKIVSLLPRTGSAKQQTDFLVNAIRLAIEENGARAGAFRLVFEDIDTASATGKWGGGREVDLAPEIDQDPDVMVCIGTYNSGAAKIFMPVFNRSNLLMISPCNSWPGLTKPGKGDPGEPEKYRPSGKINYVRVCAADDVQGPIGAEWAQKVGMKRVFILDDGEIYGKGVADGFRTRAKELGLEILGQESIDSREGEFKAVLTRIKALVPDLVYFGGTTQTKAGLIARDLVAARLTCKFLVPDGCYEDAFITSAGAENLNERCFLTFGSIPVEKLPGKLFVASYRKKYGKDPEGYAAYGYEAAKVALEAIRREGKNDRDAIRAACLAIRDFDGVLGKWSFDENGDTTLRTTGIYTVRDGKFALIEMMK